MDLLVGRARHAVRDARPGDARRAGTTAGVDAAEAAVNAADMALVSSVEARRRVSSRVPSPSIRVVVDLNADSRKCQLA